MQEVAVIYSHNEWIENLMNFRCLDHNSLNGVYGTVQMSRGHCVASFCS